MNLNNIFPHTDYRNEELTEQARNNPVLSQYKSWLINNGCLFPSVIFKKLEYPVAFGEYGVIGTEALEDLPSLKAFLFVPIELTITPQKAKNSELAPVFEQYPKLFKTHSRAADYILWLFITFEKVKGENSFYYPYFAAIGESEMLMDWSVSEKSELQDKFLVFESKKQEKIVGYFYETLVEVFRAFPQLFPKSELKEEFYWAYKMVTTRSFSHGEGMIIPLADNLNHEDVYVDYLTLSQEFLLRKSYDPQNDGKDYKDFLGTIHKSSGPTKFRTHLNRLEKVLVRNPNLDFSVVRHIWELDDLLSGVESSSDEEELVENYDESSEDKEENEGESEEEDEEESSIEEPESSSIENKYFVMRSGSEGSFLKGKQVFNCYGRLNNTDLLNEYGFCLLPNRYDSLYVRMVKTKSANGIIEIPKFNNPISARLKDLVKVYYLKYFKLNDKFLEYFRKILIFKPNDRFTVTAELKVVTQATQVLLQLENCFPTSLEEDEEILRAGMQLPIRKFFAVSKEYVEYRISQKRILKSHLSMLDTLKNVFFNLMLGKSLEDAHLADKSVNGVRVMYPLRKYLKDIKLYSTKS